MDLKKIHIYYIDRNNVLRSEVATLDVANKYYIAPTCDYLVCGVLYNGKFLKFDTAVSFVSDLKPIEAYLMTITNVDFKIEPQYRKAFSFFYITPPVEKSISVSEVGTGTGTETGTGTGIVVNPVLIPKFYLHNTGLRRDLDNYLIDITIIDDNSTQKLAYTKPVKLQQFDGDVWFDLPVFVPTPCINQSFRIPFLSDLRAIDLETGIISEVMKLSLADMEF